MTQQTTFTAEQFSPVYQPGESSDARRERLRLIGTAYRDALIAEFAPLAEAAGLTLCGDTGTEFRGEFAAVSFSFDNGNLGRTIFTRLKVKVSGRGKIERDVQKVTYRIEMDETLTPAARAKKLRKIIEKVNGHNEYGTARAASDKLSADRATADLRMISEQSARTFPELAHLSAREMKIAGTYPDGTLHITAGISNAPGARGVVYTVTCNDRLTPDEARQVADLYLKLRAERAARKEAVSA